MSKIFATQNRLLRDILPAKDSENGNVMEVDDAAVQCSSSHRKISRFFGLIIILTGNGWEETILGGF